MMKRALAENVTVVKIKKVRRESLEDVSKPMSGFKGETELIKSESVSETAIVSKKGSWLNSEHFTKNVNLVETQDRDGSKNVQKQDSGFYSSFDECDEDEDDVVVAVDLEQHVLPAPPAKANKIYNQHDTLFIDESGTVCKRKSLGPVHYTKVRHFTGSRIGRHISSPLVVQV